MSLQLNNMHRHTQLPGPCPVSPKGIIVLLLLALGVLGPAIGIPSLKSRIESPQTTEPAVDGAAAETAEAGEAGGVETGLGAPSLDIRALEEERLPIRYIPYTVASGDMISSIAKSFSLTQDSIISVNNIKNSRLLKIGQELRIPNQDGVLHTVAASETLMGIAEKHEIDIEAIRTANELSADAEPEKGSTLFLPGARLSRVQVQEINGDLFIWPARGRLTSYYGYRNDPFTGARQFHNGLDIAAPWGTALGAAMAGQVSSTGFDPYSGNYIVLTHHSGYRTFYGHLDTIRVKKGDQVRAGQRIGDIGSTGLSTGSHVHFSVYKHGRTVNPIYLLK